MYKNIENMTNDEKLGHYQDQLRINNISITCFFIAEVIYATMAAKQIYNHENIFHIGMPAAAAILFGLNKDIRIYKCAIITEKLNQCKEEAENNLKKSLVKKEK